MSPMIIGGHCHGVLPNGLSILPVANLDDRDNSECQHAACPQDHSRGQPNFPAFQQVRRIPNYCYEQANVRDVNESIAASLEAHLDETNDWCKSSQKPQPAHQKPRCSPG